MVDTKTSFRIDEVAEMWDVSVRTLQRLIRAGELQAEKKFGSFRISQEAIDEFKQRNAVVPSWSLNAIPKNTPEKGPEFLIDQLGHPNFKLSGHEFLALKRPCVYAWQRDGTILYVGMSRVGLSRAIGAHHVITALFQESDNLEVWFFATEPEAKEKERSLILSIKPVFNNLRI